MLRVVLYLTRKTTVEGKEMCSQALGSKKRLSKYLTSIEYACLGELLVSYDWLVQAQSDEGHSCKDAYPISWWRWALHRLLEPCLLSFVHNGPRKDLLYLLWVCDALNPFLDASFNCASARAQFLALVWRCSNVNLFSHGSHIQYS